MARLKIRKARLRPVRLDECTETVTVEIDPTPIRGNAIASDDDKADRELEDQLIARLNDGDDWAWFEVVVELRWGAFMGGAALCGCSYASREDFEANLLPELRVEALADLNRQIAQAARRIDRLRGKRVA